MEYTYTLTQENLKQIGLKPTKQKEYHIYQNGWTGTFSSLYEVINNRYGSFKGKEIIRGKELTEKQKDYIINNCICEEE